MTAQPEYTGPSGPVPPMRTLAELREALIAYGFAGDRQEFDAELGAVDLDDLTRVREIVQAYRHRVLLARDPHATAAIARSNDDVAAELRRKLSEAGAR
ncbi:hypothetical protein ACFY8X_38565 [Streptomyces tanashiensis]|uniref:hypothetical protein n=1 Tax=Streptomyces tanashiensis TaxID=67367 RepID=UPI0036F18C8E